MIPVSYYVPEESTSPKFAHAFARGCKGTISADLDYLFPGPVAMFGSPPVWPIIRRAQAAGVEWIYGDHAYFGRGQYYRVTRNAYQHPGTGPGSAGRFAVFGRPVQPWRKTGAHILLCPNSAAYFRLHDLDVDAWVSETTTALRAHTDRTIVVRWKHDRPPIAAALVNAWACVVFSSAAAIDALIAGVPVFTLSPFAATVRMGLSDPAQIEHPIYPEDRLAFLQALAAHQWTIPELAQGIAWRSLCREREAA